VHGVTAYKTVRAVKGVVMDHLP